jgi:sugar/nucleoside kinase (ribokinase family)
VDTDALVVTREAGTCQVIAMLEPDGERSLVVWPPDGGALRWLRPEDVPAEALAAAAWLHTTGMCLRNLPVRDAVLAAMAGARAAGVPVSIDLNLRVELWGLDAERCSVLERAIGLADYVLGSGPEELVPLAAAIASGASDERDDAAADAVVHASRDLSGGARTVVARLGGSGVLACAADGTIVHSPAFVVEVANVIGAGDSFNAGFIAAMVEGRGLPEALRWANAVAARKVGRPAGTSDLPTRAEVEALLS